MLTSFEDYITPCRACPQQFMSHDMSKELCQDCLDAIENGEWDGEYED